MTTTSDLVKQEAQDKACDLRKEAFDQWYFFIHGVYPDLLNRDTDRAMWLGWSAGYQQLERENAEFRAAAEIGRQK